MTELLKVLNQRISAHDARITAPSVHTVLEAFGLANIIAYTWKPKYGTSQYTNAFADWLEDRVRKDVRFDVKVRNKLRREARSKGA
jgi:hypothetical protein